MTIRFKAFCENASRISEEDKKSSVSEIYMDLLCKWDEEMYAKIFNTGLDPVKYPKNLGGFLLHVERNLSEYISACSHMDDSKSTACEMCKGRARC